MAGNEKSGKKRYDMGERRVPVSVSMSPALFKVIDSSVVLGSFSMKIEHLILEWMAFKQMLIQYRNDEQKTAGTPVVLNRHAERIYSQAEFQSGYAHIGTKYEITVQRVLEKLSKAGYKTKGAKWILDVVVPALRDEGLVVQIVNELEYDLLDIWVVDAMLGEGAKNCGNCDLVNEISDFIRKIKERSGIRHE